MAKVSSVQLLSHVWVSATPWTAAHQASLSITNSRSLLKLMSIESVIPSDYLILCHPLLPPSIFPSIRVFSNESVLCSRWPKYWSISISLSSEYSGWISFQIDWLDLLAVQGTLKSLLQHQSSEVSIFWCSAFFIGQLSHPYVTTGKTITLTRWTFVGKVMSLLFNMLSRLIITFLSRSKHLLISWLSTTWLILCDNLSVNLDIIFKVTSSFSLSLMYHFPIYHLCLLMLQSQKFWFFTKVILVMNMFSNNNNVLIFVLIRLHVSLESSAYLFYSWRTELDQVNAVRDMKQQ